MKRILIPGFATGPSLFSAWPDLTGCEVLKNLTNSWQETKQALSERSAGQKLHIFGWSLGALFGLRWALENQDSVGSLFLTGATARFTRKDGYDAGAAEQTLKDMIRLVPSKRELVMRNFFSSFMDAVPERKTVLENLMTNCPGTDSLLAGLSELLETDLLDGLPGLRIPIRIVQGSGDRITPPAGAAWIADRVASAKLEFIEGGHGLFLEKPGKLEKEWISWTN